MTTIRLVDAVDVNGNKVPCSSCEEWLVSSTDDDGQEFWDCVQGCPGRVYPNVGGYATEGGPEFRSKPCKRCGDPIVLARHVTGVKIPVNAHPSERGSIELKRGFNGELTASVKPGRLGLHTAHRRNCTEAVA